MQSKSRKMSAKPKAQKHSQLCPSFAPFSLFSLCQWNQKLFFEATGTYYVVSSADLNWICFCAVCFRSVRFIEEKRQRNKMKKIRVGSTSHRQRHQETRREAANRGAKKIASKRSLKTNKITTAEVHKMYPVSLLVKHCEL
jgi:hypothetical protein